MIKKILITSMFFGLLSATTASAATKGINNISQAINISGKQRMLSQRMLKDYTLIGMAMSITEKDDLKKITKLFTKSILDLKEFAKKYKNDKDTLKSLDKVAKLWVPIRTDLYKKATKEKAPELQRRLQVLLGEANTATVAFTKSAGTKSADIVNISGRQRMLSQKIGSLYMMKVWGIDDPEFKNKMNQAMQLFLDSHKKLSEFKGNDEKINNLLTNVEENFEFFVEAWKGKTEVRIPMMINMISNEILKDMNTVTEHYVTLKIGQ